MKFPALTKRALSGTEDITGSGLRVMDYWAWAHSVIEDNTERGIFAEFLLHSALNAADSVRVNWAECDVLSPEGIRVEVKSSGYLQSSGQEKLSAIRFSIKPSRSSDVYVFCLHDHTQQESLNILNLEQWTFFVLKTSVLNDCAPKQKTITIKRLKSLGAAQTDYSGLRAAVIQVAKNQTKIRSDKFCVNAN